MPSLDPVLPPCSPHAPSPAEGPHGGKQRTGCHCCGMAMEMPLSRSTPGYSVPLFSLPENIPSICRQCTHLQPAPLSGFSLTGKLIRRCQH